MIQKRNRTVLFPTVFSLVILMVVSIVCVSASPQLPCEFYGSVSVNGAPAPAGTVISAYVNSAQQGKITVTEAGKYGGTGTFDERLIVLAGENDFTGGVPTITFKIGDKVADQTVQYEPGMSTELSLSSGGGTAAVPSALSVSAASVTGTGTPTVQAATPAPVSNVSAVPVATPPVVQTPVAPVVTAPAPQISSPVQAVSVSAPVNQTAVLPAAPVVTVSQPVQVVSAPQSPNQIVQTPAAPVLAPVNQSLINATNTTIVAGNASPVVSFPSGQTLTP